MQATLFSLVQVHSAACVVLQSADNSKPSPPKPPPNKIHMPLDSSSTPLYVRSMLAAPHTLRCTSYDPALLVSSFKSLVSSPPAVPKKILFQTNPSDSHASTPGYSQSVEPLDDDRQQASRKARCRRGGVDTDSTILCDFDIRRPRMHHAGFRTARCGLMVHHWGTYHG